MNSSVTQFCEPLDNLSYPENTTYCSVNGFLHNLTSEQENSLHEIKEWTINQDIKISELTFYLIHPTLILLRYLRANSFNTQKTKDHILKTLLWRQEMNLKELMTNSPEDILGCSWSQLIDVFPHWHCGYDKTGRPGIIFFDNVYLF
jgi:hypothetical protein